MTPAAGSHSCSKLAGRQHLTAFNPPFQTSRLPAHCTSPTLATGPLLLQQEAARQRLLAATGAAAARDVRVRLHVLEHRAQLAFLPAFHLTYCHGEALNAHGERVPARCEALIGGTGEGLGGGKRVCF